MKPLADSQTRVKGGAVALPAESRHAADKKLHALEAVQAAVRKAVAQTTVTDIHTHLFPPSHGKMLLWGVDELVTYHYLVAELFTVAPRELTPEAFWTMPKARQAELIWEHVFLRRSPLSEAGRGVLTTLKLLGIDVANRDLGAIRRWFVGRKVEEYLPRVFKLANIDYAVMTNNPFVAGEAACLGQDLPCPPCLRTALRIDTLLLDWPAAAKAMTAQGYRAAKAPTAAGFAAARRFLKDWAGRIKPVYMAASMPPDFAYPGEAYRSVRADDEAGQAACKTNAVCAAVLDEVVLPLAAELRLPVAMMIGVRRRVNPALGDGCDGLGVADPLAVQNLCGRHGGVKFLVTMLSRVNQQELAVLARKFGNLHVFGCWWFCNNPSVIEEMMRMRLELLGTAFTCQHSDARVLDQLIYKWSHTRSIAEKVLTDKFSDLFQTGWRTTEAEIQRDVRRLLGGAFEEFLAK